MNRKVLRLDLNSDNVCKFLRSAGSEFQRYSAMKLKERSPKDFRFCLGILRTFLWKIGETEIVHRCRGMKKDTEVKTLRNGDRPELRSYTGSGISQVTSEVL